MTTEFTRNAAVSNRNADDRVAKSRPRRKAEVRANKENVYASIRETKFNRYIRHDLAKYRDYVASGGAAIYSEDELDALERAGVSNRLPPRATGYYLDLAAKSPAIANLIKARPEETDDLSGEADPSNQLKYSPTPGLLHKYELCLLYVVRTCSSWCRYCYRSDFLTGKTGKDTAGIGEIVDYIRRHNDSALTKGPIAGSDRNEAIKIREALLSGGDPMVLSNRNLFDYLCALSEAGVEVVRIGTKELAFFPERFDDAFFEMLDLFHELHPDTFLAFMVHFTHPDEFLARDPRSDSYVQTPNGRPQRLELVSRAIERLRSRAYVTLENQTPIIDGVNDDAEALRLMQRELKRMGVNNHYFFQCREIEGHRAFAVPVEEAWAIHRESQIGLSGIERSRFALSTEAGKLEMVSVIDGPRALDLPPEVDGVLGDGVVVFKLHRTPVPDRLGDLVIARRNPEALWISGYEDRMLYDGRQSGDARLAPLVAATLGALATAAE